MLEKAKTILGRLDMRSADGVADAWSHGQTSVSDDGGTADETTTDDSVTASPTHLYKCPSCDHVYVATDKHTCSTCDTDVDRVE
jgi:hypothetical protein